MYVAHNAYVISFIIIAVSHLHFYIRYENNKDRNASIIRLDVFCFLYFLLAPKSFNKPIWSLKCASGCFGYINSHLSKRNTVN